LSTQKLALLFYIPE